MFANNSNTNAIDSVATNYSSQNFQGPRLALWRGWTSPLLAGYNAPPPTRAASPPSPWVASATPPLSSRSSESSYSSSFASPVFGPTDYFEFHPRYDVSLPGKNINHEYYAQEMGLISSSTPSSPPPSPAFVFDAFAEDVTTDCWKNRWTLSTERDPIVDHGTTSGPEFFDRAIKAPKSRQDLAWANWRTVRAPRPKRAQQSVAMDIMRMEQDAERL
ncbi:hypothetical protein BDP27DRAFT_1360810 [Rhodocollybia butyracea]|uniref:Uncharacterized protein n=1 Tax=Rhodocollybia butyracea TaxID=206335 RepID=A0A9P5UC30_9AGAR|nr:hypothetical protein BDP27DRAFT_1360810 [Rhodocollybia butyracea]